MPKAQQSEVRALVKGGEGAGRGLHWGPYQRLFEPKEQMSALLRSFAHFFREDDWQVNGRGAGVSKVVKVFINVYGDRMCSDHRSHSPLYSHCSVLHIPQHSPSHRHSPTVLPRNVGASRTCF